jgi:hypothetical protein
MNPTKESQFVVISDLFNGYQFYFWETNPAMANREPTLECCGRLTGRPPKHSEAWHMEQG